MDLGRIRGKGVDRAIPVPNSGEKRGVLEIRQLLRPERLVEMGSSASTSKGTAAGIPGSAWKRGNESKSRCVQGTTT